MWIMNGVLSVLFCVLGWILCIRKNEKAVWAAFVSMAFTALTLLQEYQLVNEWVRKQEWGSLEDVVPTMLVYLTVYVIGMILANLLLIVGLKKGRSETVMRKKLKL